MHIVTEASKFPVLRPVVKMLYLVYQSVTEVHENSCTEYETQMLYVRMSTLLKKKKKSEG